MLLLSLLALRIPDHPTEHSLLPSLSSSEVPDFLASHTHSVLIHATNSSRLDYLDFAIARYRGQLFFALTNTTADEGLSAFLNGTRLAFESPPQSPTAVANWCEQVLNADSPRVSVAEQLRQIFDMRDPLFLCVDCDRRPPNVPVGVLCFLVNRSAVLHFAADARPGLYLYRPKDRQLLVYIGDFEAEKQTPIKSITDNFETKEYFCGYLLDWYELDSELFVQNLIDLSSEFSQQFDFLLVQRDDGSELLQRGRFFRQRPPFFFVMRSGTVGAKRWYLERDAARDLSHIRGFLGRITTDIEPYTVAHSDVAAATGPFLEVNALTLEKVVSDNLTATLLLLVSAACPYCKDFKPVVEAVAGLLDPNTVKVLWMDGPSNDVPDIIPVAAYYPALLLWPAGRKDVPPIEFGSSNRTVGAVLAFVSESSGVKS
jgi:hypothetical protein